MTETEIILLTNYIAGAPSRWKHVPGRGDTERVDEYQILVTAEQRDELVNALQSYHPKPKDKIR